MELDGERLKKILIIRLLPMNDSRKGLGWTRKTEGKLSLMHLRII